MDMDTPERSATSALWAEQLRAERAAKRLSRAELAKAAGIAPKTIQRLEENAREMDTDQLDRLCKVFGIGVTEFVVRAAARGRAAGVPGRVADEGAR